MAHRTIGNFITLEGGEGSGKTTLLYQLKDFLGRRGCEVVLTREPGGTVLGEQIRGLLLNPQGSTPISPLSELLLFLAARAQHIQEVILPAIRAGKIVLCDRFNDSTIAYQGSARGLGVDYVKKLCHEVCGAVVPSLTLFLEVTPEVGLARAKKVQKEYGSSGEFDRIESEAIHFHKKIQDALQTLAKEEPFRIHIINAELPQEAVHNEAVAILQKQLSL